MMMIHAFMSAHKLLKHSDLSSHAYFLHFYFSAGASESDDRSFTPKGVLPWTGFIVWPLMLTVPLMLTSPYSPTSYKSLFPQSWYDYDPSSGETPKPLGLCLGILAVFVGQVFVWGVFYLHKYGHLSFGQEPTSIQTKGARGYEWMEGIMTHISQPEGFVLLIGYLSGTWMFKLMPDSYYSFDGGIEWGKVAACLALQDSIQYIMHRLEHDIHPKFYQISHKPHHKFTNPRLFDAFNGSITDTICMIQIPLYIVANLVHCNVWSYMAFGSMYANWLTLIHSEYVFPWDNLFHLVGFGTPADHHVHHAFFKFNFGHLFMWSDMIAGTYKHPQQFAPKYFNRNV